MTAKGIDLGPERRASEVGQVLAAALAAEPLAEWLIPDPRERPGELPLFFTWLALEVLLDDGRVHCLTADGTPSGELAAVALWRDHTRSHDHSLGSAWNPTRMLRMVGVEPRRAFALEEAFDHTTPLGAYPEEHEELLIAGVHPAHQGRGLGSRLLREAHEAQDINEVSAFAVAVSPRRRALLAGHGYRDHGRPVLLRDGGPTLWPMWRAPEVTRERPSVDRSAGLTVPGGSDQEAVGRHG